MPHHAFAGHLLSWRSNLPTCFYLELAELSETGRECILCSQGILAEAAAAEGLSCFVEAESSYLDSLAETPSYFVEAEPSYLDSLPLFQDSSDLAEKSSVTD